MTFTVFKQNVILFIIFQTYESFICFNIKILVLYLSYCIPDVSILFDQIQAKFRAMSICMSISGVWVVFTPVMNLVIFPLSKLVEFGQDYE